MLIPCSQKADDLVTALSDGGYSQECVEMASELTKCIGEYEKANPEDVPTVRTTESKYGEKDDDDDKEEKKSPFKKDPRDMSEEEMKKDLKKGGIIIQFDA